MKPSPGNLRDTPLSQSILTNGWRQWVILLLCVGFFLPSLPGLTQDSTPKTRIKVKGYGFWGNRELKQILRLLESGETATATYNDIFIEDAVLVLQAKLIRDGFLRPTLKAVMTLTDGSIVEEIWAPGDETDLPPDLEARDLLIQVEKGIFYYYEDIEFQGLNAIEQEDATSYFMDSGFLLETKSSRRFSMGQLRRSLMSLREVLVRRGYETASVTSTNLNIDHQSGKTEVTVDVKEGPLHLIRSLELNGLPADIEPEEEPLFQPGQPYSFYWLRDYIQQQKARIYRLGYPDTQITVEKTHRETGTTNHWVDLELKVVQGTQVTVRDLVFKGLEKTKEIAMEKHLDLQPGDLLDRTAAEHDRHKLAALGIFRTVQLDYEPEEESSRDVIYEVEESKTLDLSLLLGYGSYELLRGGFELERRNLFGLAHQSRWRAIQSFKSTSTDFRYSVPRVFGTEANMFFNANALVREETSFTREEWGGNLGAQRYLVPIQSDASVRYNYSLLQANDADADISGTVKKARVGSVIFDLQHDGRDNPLFPTRGFKVNGTMEIAASQLGGEVNFERFEFGASYHFGLTKSLFVHLGVLHGLTFTFTSDSDDLPFNKRFFPGGENSVRGFKQGEASPRDEDRNIIGAETYLQSNIEVEQMLTRSWSVVAFLDSVMMAQDMSDYLSDEDLHSVGAGIRWRTFIGPARLEYGHNLNPRRKDPDGTLHFSIGFPF